jgi:5'-nucleotidase
MNRRHFLERIGTGALLVGTGNFPLQAFAFDKPEIVRLTILHTNDVHSRIDPFPMDGSRNQGLGGVAKRASLLKQIRAQEKNVLLFDAGDIFQGTPYFNLYGGELEMKLMSQLGYDAGTIGNHDFDAGIEGLAKQMAHANFPLLTANYDFSNTVMKGKTQPHKIFTKQGVKIGVFGLGIELDGLVKKTDYKETTYLDPLSKANETAAFLKKEMRCDYIVCLSHLGYQYSRPNEKNRASDVRLAENSRHIDLIIGGHTHTFMDKPDIRKNLDGAPCLINQVGFAGILLGRIDVLFERTKNSQCATCQNIWVGKNL